MLCTHVRRQGWLQGSHSDLRTYKQTHKLNVFLLTYTCVGTVVTPAHVVCSTTSQLPRGSPVMNTLTAPHTHADMQTHARTHTHTVAVAEETGGMREGPPCCTLPVSPPVSPASVQYLCWVWSPGIGGSPCWPASQGWQHCDRRSTSAQNQAHGHTLGPTAPSSSCPYKTHYSSCAVLLYK